jgi:putative colanic acid biosysnthesis UDP-glucose lipid carrier transferase
MATTKLAEHPRDRRGEGRLRRRPVERTADAALAGLAFSFVLPLFAVIALLIVIADPGPVFVRTREVRFDGHPFDLLRFRIRRIGSDGIQQSTAQYTEDRGSRCNFKLGALLHHTGLDDLPMLINLARGELPIAGHFTWRQVLAWLASSDR